MILSTKHKSKSALKPEHQAEPSIDHGRHFFTYDAGCASALMTVGYLLIYVDREEGKRIRFVFTNEGGIAETAVNYLSRQLTLDACTFFTAIKALEKRIADG